mmetsp:Transcript_29411/g.83753  ORF Transcript_29411/g.83753 Transcript_29411/m.83753 type:complete len:440 (-) Transcript_29411:74-1393(-)
MPIRLAACVAAALASGAAAARTLGIGGSWLRAAEPLPELAAEGRRLTTDLAVQVLDLAHFRYRVASSFNATSLTVWEPQGTHHALLSHGSEIAGVRFLASGERLLTWSADGLVKLWDAASGRLLRKLDEAAPIGCLAVFPEGDRLIACGPSFGCRVRATDTGKLLRAPPVSVGPNFNRMFVRVFPDGRRVLTLAREDRAVLWDASVGRPICSLNGHEKLVLAARLFPDGARAVTGGSDRRAIVWSTSTCQALVRLHHTDWVRQVEVFGDDLVATILTSGTVTIWEPTSGTMLRRLPFHSPMEHVLSVKAVPGCHRLLTLELRDYGARAVSVWNATTGKRAARIAQYDDVEGLAFSPGGDMAATCTAGGGLMLWDPATGGRFRIFPGPSREAPVAVQTELASSGPTCLVAIGVGSAIDERGFGPGLSWRAHASLAPPPRG